MQSDEEQLRALVSAWMAATKAGDLEAVLSLMADDVVFLVPGRPPMRKSDFAAATKAQTGQSAPEFDAASDIKEIRVLGDWAFMWTELTVTATPRDGSPQMRRAGHTLSILNRQHGKWVLARDANLLGPAQPAGT